MPLTSWISFSSPDTETFPCVLLMFRFPLVFCWFLLEFGAPKTHSLWHQCLFDRECFYLLWLWQCLFFSLFSCVFDTTGYLGMWQEWHAAASTWLSCEFYWMPSALWHRQRALIRLAVLNTAHNLRKLVTKIWSFWCKKFLD